MSDAVISQSPDLRLKPLLHNDTHNLMVLKVDIDKARAL